MRTAGIFGGNFDPVHNGHLITAQKIYELRKPDKIIFIPAFISPFKKGMKSTPAEHRLNMIKIAIKDIPYFEWSDIEINSAGISYTIDTLKKLRNKFDKLELIIGYDNIVDFPEWKDPDEIIKLASIIVLKRSLRSPVEKRNRFFEYAVFADTPLIEISGTDIRNRIRNGLSVDFLVPDKVKRYIYKNNLYKE